MIIPFMLLRKFSGGYHAKTLFRCMIISCLLLFLCMEITIHISYSWNILVFAGIAGSSLIIQSPIDSENKRLEEVQKRQYRKIVCGFVMFFLALIFILWKLNAQKYAVSIAVGIWLIGRITDSVFDETINFSQKWKKNVVSVLKY